MYIKVSENKNRQPLKNEANEKGIIKYRIRFNGETETYELLKYVKDET